MLRALKIAKSATTPFDHLTLTEEDRYLRRRVVRSEAGLSILIDLPEPMMLRHGDRLELEDARTVEVVAANEPLAEVTGDDLARYAWHIGNRHTPCQIDAGRLLIKRDHVLENMLRGLGAAIVHLMAPFQPEGGAYGHGRTHGHVHSHDPHHDPNAHIHG